MLASWLSRSDIELCCDSACCCCYCGFETLLSWKLAFECTVFDPFDYADIRVTSALVPFELDVFIGF